MKRVAAFLISFVVLFSAVPANPLTCEQSIAFAAPTANIEAASYPPYAFSYTYYSDLAFKDGGSVTLAVGKKKQLDLINTTGAIRWTSSNNNVASVSNAGVVTAKCAGVTRITAKSVRANRSIVCTVKVYKKRTQAQARKAILALKKSYYPGRQWTNRNYYYWQAANCHCYGCIAFAGIASDTTFGKYAPFKRHAKFSKIKVGDHVRISGNHSVIVLYKYKKSIAVAEGNYNDTFNWGRKISYADLRREGFYVETRY